MAEWICEEVPAVTIDGKTISTMLHQEQELVRCKDCKHVCLCDTKEMFPDMPVYAKCTLTDEIHEPDWYCADGELKDS